jgi:osmotically-inducible protein OsmY
MHSRGVELIFRRDRTMFGNDAATDKALHKMVMRRLQRSGSQGGLNAVVQRGSVTITGKLQHESQRLVVIKALRSVSGVRNVIDQLQSPPKKKPEISQQRPSQPAAEPIADTSEALSPQSVDDNGDR